MMHNFNTQLELSQPHILKHQSDIEYHEIKKSYLSKWMKVLNFQFIRENYGIWVKSKDITYLGKS